MRERPIGGLGRVPVATLPWRPSPSPAVSLDVSNLGWIDQAACAEVGSHPFFPPRSGDAPYLFAAAKAVCARCPVTAECLEDVMGFEARPDILGRHGVWSGMTPDEREQEQRRRNAEAAA